MKTIIVFLIFSSVLVSIAPTTESLVQTKYIKGVINPLKNEDSHRFKLTIAQEIFKIKIDLEPNYTPLRMVLLTNRNEILASATKTQGHQSIEIDRLSSESPLSSGDFEIEVSLDTDDAPVEMIPLNLSITTIRAKPLQSLSLGSVLRTKIDPKDGAYQIFELITPSNYSVIRIDLSAKTADLDLCLLSSPQPELNKIVDSIRKTHGNESLIIEGVDLKKINAQHPLKTYVMVESPYDDAEQSFEIVSTLSRDPPSELKKLVNLPTRENGIPKSVLSTVEIFTRDATGSGCLISSSGYVLTNFHVIQSSEEEVYQIVDIGITTNPEQPSEVIFMAKVIEYDAKLDLALLKIDKTLYDIALPSNYKFPFFDLGPKPQLGDDLVILGYPSIGSLGSRTTISLSRGGVSGFAPSASGLMIKTDAIINSGSSGGAALNSKFKLIGLPTLILGEDSSQFGYIVPIQNIPEKWLKLIQAK